MRSASYATIATHKILFGWHRKYPYWWVLKTVKEARQLAKTKSTNIDYKRVYIPKPGDQWRPLGVPSASWRIYLNMYSTILRWYIQPHIPSSQHGYIANRGILTAWEEIVNKVINQPDIYEFDLKQFFPSVSTSYISKLLQERCHLPIKEIYYLQDMFKSLPKLPKELKLPEEWIVNRKTLEQVLTKTKQHPQIC